MNNNIASKMTTTKINKYNNEIHRYRKFKPVKILTNDDKDLKYSKPTLHIHSTVPTSEIPLKPPYTTVPTLNPPPPAPYPMENNVNSDGEYDDPDPEDAKYKTKHQIKKDASPEDEAAIR